MILQLSHHPVLSDDVLAILALVHHDAFLLSLCKIPLTLLGDVEPVQLIVELPRPRDRSVIGHVEQDIRLRPRVFTLPDLDLPDILPTELTAMLDKEVSGTDTIWGA